MGEYANFRNYDYYINTKVGYFKIRLNSTKLK